MSMLLDAMASLRTCEDGAFGETVVYVRESGTSFGLKAVPGRSVFRERNEYGSFVRLETRDFLVRGTAFTTEPQPGDAIVWGGRRFEVLAPAGEPCWRWSDPMHTAMRIHTKLTEGTA